MKSQNIRKAWENFWISKNHTYLPEANLQTPAQEKTTLFNQSGMQQLIPYLAGKPHKLGTRLFNIQKCIRTLDIDEVGDASHLTVFEMMGNRSLGDYFKEDAIKRSWELLTQIFQLDPKKLSVTVFEGDENSPADEISAKIWKEVGIPDHKISYMGAEDNRWSPGPVGPCGPDTEIFYWIGDKNGGPEYPPEDSNVKTDEDNRMEIWNNVFMEYYRDEHGAMTKLKKQNVDTGMGFERIAMVLQSKDTIFETDIFVAIIEIIEKFTGLSYNENKRRMRIVADHVRTAVFLIDDGVICSNVGAGYILRMIIRRMYYNMILLNELDFEQIQKFIGELVQTVFDLNQHRNLNTKKAQTDILAELEHFQKTINRGIKLLHEKFKSNPETLSGKDAFMLYDTYGFPIELTKEICEAKGIKLDICSFKNQLNIARAKSRQATEKMFDKGIDWSRYLEGVKETEFIGYDLDIKANDIKVIKDLNINGQRVLILNKTPFYAESGGQTGDNGEIELDNGEKLSIKDVKKYEGIFLHFVE